MAMLFSKRGGLCVTRRRLPYNESPYRFAHSPASCRAGLRAEWLDWRSRVCEVTVGAVWIWLIGPT
jgi:hypothetical protein